MQFSKILNRIIYGLMLISLFSCFKGRDIPTADNYVAPVYNIAAPVITVTDGEFTDRIEVSWSAVASAQQYDIYRVAAPVSGDCDAAGLVYTKLSTTTNLYYEDSDTSLQVSTYYCYKARSYATDKGYSNYSAGAKGKKVLSYQIAAPGSSTISASNGTYTDKIRIAWAEVAGAEKYYIYRCELSGSCTAFGLHYSKIGNVDVATTANFYTSGATKYYFYDDTTAVAGTVYCYKIKSWSAAKGFSDFSVPVQGMRLSSYGLTNPDNTQNTGSDNYTDRIRITWASVSGAEKYYVYRSTTLNGAYNEIAVVLSTQNNYVKNGRTYYYYEDTNITAGTTYYYKIKAWSTSGGFSDFTDPISGSTGTGTFTTPTNPGASTGTYAEYIKISWTKVTGAEKYYVFRTIRGADSSGTYIQIGTVDAASPVDPAGMSDTNTYYYKDYKASSSSEDPWPGYTYYYKVQAWSASGGFSGFTDPVSGNLSSGYTQTAPSTGLSGSQGNYTDKIVITWAAVSGAEKYYVYRSGSSTGEFNQVGVVLSTENNYVSGGVTYYYYVDTNVTANTTYYYKIKSWSTANGYSDFSSVITGSTGSGTYTAPTSPTATNGSYTDYIKITWAKVSGAEKYYVFRTVRGAVSTGDYIQIAEVSASSPSGNAGWEVADATYFYKDMKASNANEDPWTGFTYYYKVQAWSSSGGFSGFTDPVSGNLATAKVATPSFDKATGNYTANFSVTITDATTGSSIYYSTDGVDPVVPATCGSAGSGNSTLYSSAVSITATTTLKAIACRSNYENSAVQSATFTMVADINVKQGTNDVLTGGSFDFGSLVDTDHADCGGAAVCTVTKTFTIENIGKASLNLTGATDKVVLSGDAAFSITSAQPSSPVGIGGSVTFDVRMQSNTTGSKTATITIASNDPDEASYTFTLNGTVTAGLEPEINVKQGGTNILTGGSYNYGTVIKDASSNIAFTLENLGQATLTLTGTPKVNVTGTNAGMFVVQVQPGGTISVGSNVTVNIVFTPSTVGSKTATVTIVNSDTNEGSYTFTLNGTGGVATPASPTATDGTYGDKVTISWSATTGADRFNVYRDTSSGGSFSTQVCTNIAGTTCDDSSATAGTLYYYKVEGKDNATGSVSALSSADTGYKKLPAPTTVTATDGSFTTEVGISWTSVTGADRYKVYRDGSLITTTTGTSYDDTGATPGVGHSYTVKSTDDDPAHDSDASSTNQGYLKLATPTGLTASEGTSTSQVALSWTAVTGASGYKVYRDASYLATAATNSYNDTTAVAGTSYTYTVTAIDDSPAQETAQSTSDSGYLKLSAPTGLAASDGTSTTQVAMTWNTVSGATGYKVYRGGSYLATTATNSYNDTGAVAGTSYSYTVTATDDSPSQESAQSSGDSGYVGLSVPGSVSSTDGAYTDKVTVGWAAVSGATGYKVYRGGSLLGTSATTTYDDTTAVPGTSYSYTVTATDDSPVFETAASTANNGYRQLSLSAASVTATDGTSSTEVAVSWTYTVAASGSYDKVRVYRAISATSTCSAADSSYVLLTTVTSGTSSYNDTSAASKQYFCYKITAYNSSSGAESSKADCTANNGWRNGPFQAVGSAGFSTNAARYTSVHFYNGTPYVAYKEGTSDNGSIFAKYYNGSNWVDLGTNPIATDAEQYPMTKIYVASASEVYVAYARYNGGYSTSDMRVYKYNGSSWTSLGTIGTGDYNYSYLNLSYHGGSPYVSYRDSSDNIVVKKYNGSSWEGVGGSGGNGVVDTGYSGTGGSYLGFFVYDNAGTAEPYVVYTKTTSSILCKKYSSSTWSNVGTSGQVGTDPYTSGTYVNVYVYNGTPYVAYRNSSQYLYVKYLDGSSWTTLGGASASGSDTVTRLNMKVVDGVVYIGYNMKNGFTDLWGKIRKYSGSWSNVGGTNATYDDGILGKTDSDQTETDSYISIDFYNGSVYAAYTDFSSSYGGKITVKY